MALHRYGDFRVEVFYFDSPCIILIGGMYLSLFIIDVFTVTLCPVFIEDKCHILSQWHFVRWHFVPEPIFSTRRGLARVKTSVLTIDYCFHSG